MLEEALARFPAVGLKILKRSGWWRSAAWPDPNGPEYRNGVALVEANAGPEAVLRSLLDLEAQMGRGRAGRNAPRTLDLDLIAHGREVRDTPGLVLPHPRAHGRAFVLVPSLIVGYYGQNFESAFDDRYWSIGFSTGLIVVTTLVQLALYRWRRWI